MTTTTTTCPVGYGLWSSSTCKPCPVGWTTTSDGATQNMWQGCTVPCSEAMMSNAATGCKGAWYKTLSYPQVYGDGQAVSCTAECSAKGLQCNWKTLNFTSTVGLAQSVFDLLGVLSSCNPSTIAWTDEWARQTKVSFTWEPWIDGLGQLTCGGCAKTCYVRRSNVVAPDNACDLKHWDYKRMCPCGNPSAEGTDMTALMSVPTTGAATVRILVRSLSSLHTHTQQQQQQQQYHDL
jgi:hypothetical protein